MIVDPERYANEYELDAKVDIDSKRESGSVPIVAMRLWLRAAHAVVELTGPTDGDGKTFGSDGNVSLWLHKSDLALGNVLLDRISSENAKLRELAAGIGHLLFALDVDYCAGCPMDDINHPCPVYTVKGGECLYETDLRDLGVEVDG